VLKRAPIHEDVVVHEVVAEPRPSMLVIVRTDLRRNCSAGQF